ncbi:MAG: aldo/keto reductase [Candidatus Marinimicrobia bacterium]|nr:aldo/keto reductase [Candidatus Neomarinimicrobiota bacterium]MCF7827594.1 aldo/keto reductase [Candidatus Neomarinimicrobiota bacterium]MCF7881545.1 aldo/keto reductase [Candidatus Neomarinimicrobiota bacterium]
MALSRREFIKLTAASAAWAVAGMPILAESRNGMPYRKLGKTGLEVSLLTVGGYSIGIDRLTDKESIEMMRTAIDEGINFFDNAWHYHDGQSEERMGKALQDGYREKVILMTKHHGRNPENARQHLEESLRRLQTDYIDVWQFHEIDEQWEIDSIYDSGVLDFAQKAKEEGKIRHIGFTGHFRPALHLDMIHRGFDWETVQMPINPLDNHYLSFTQNVLPTAIEKNIGVIGMKSLAGGALYRENILTPEEGLRFAMTQPVSTVCSGMQSLEELKENIEITRNFEPMSEEEITSLLKRTINYAVNGEYEWYKSYTPDPDHEYGA